MNNSLIVLLTVILESLFLYIIAALFSWKWIDIAFLGGLAIFGVLWIFHYQSAQTRNRENASIRGNTGITAESIHSPLHFHLW
ncbi:hypothetical protein [Thalassobacillus sp. CUG 92003]|uniref:hypothetical protein n=1 Tax=Thalassobacillus sp. CUG 92003 TaxID=2736641 RepID=UPI0015E7145F|nr:hypothetical protein [Thalassobacillus sp. CUG 92003]